MSDPGTDFDDAAAAGWEAGERVPVSPFDYPEERPDDRSAAIREAAARLEAAREATREIVRHVIDSRGAASAGRKLMVLAFLLGETPGIRTQRQLAQALRISPPAVAKLMSQARGYLRESARR